MAINNLIKVRRGSASDWSSNPTLSQGEPGFDTTNNILKIGDGTTAWNSLSAVNNTDHPSISAASSADNSGNTFIQDLTLDSNGHVTAIVSATASEGGSGGISNVVEDTTPQLGGNLDLNSKDITGTGDIDVTGSGHFSSNVRANSFVKDGGTSSQFLKADGSVDSNAYITSVEDDGSPVLGGSLTLDQHDINVQVKNDSGSSISAGTPVYIAAYHAGSSKPLIAPANASSTSTMPAFGIVANTIADEAEGFVAIMGIVAGIDTTSPISFSTNDIVYVKAGGGLTNVKPTGVSEQIQNLGKVTKVHNSNGRILLLGAGRSNDIPNSGTFNGNVQAASFIKSGGTSSEFLKADGSVDTSTYLTAHPSISAASSSDNSGRTYIQDIGLDSNGHVTSITTETETVTDTNTQLTEEQVEDFVGGMVTGNTETGITVTYQDDDGTIDFVVASQTDENFTTADHSKLDGIEASADVTDTANVTSAGALMDSELTDLAGVKGVTISTLQVKPSEGAFSDGDKTKLDAIEASADVTDTANVTSAGALMDSEVTNLSQVKAFDSSDYATAAQGTKADSAQQPPSEGAFANGDKTKLDGIEASADVTDTANVTSAGALMDSELTDLAGVKGVTISTLQVKPSEGAFANGDKTKLDGIEASADVTDTTNVTAAGALMDSELTDLAGVKGVTISTLQVKPSEGAFANGDKTKLDAIEASADVTDATNVNAAGAVMNSDSTTAGMSFVVDEDNMSSDSDTKVPTQQSVKAYVDATIVPALTTEQVQDIVGGMVDDTETGISVTYDDTNGNLEFVVDHDAANNFVANEHIDHTSVTLTAGDGLTGGGDISANRTFAVNVDDSTIEINSDALRIKDDGVTSAKIGALTDLLRWEYPDKGLDGDVASLGYLRAYDESGGYAGFGVSTSSFNIGTSGAVNMRFITAGSERAIINTDGDFIFNEAGAAVDFRVEGDTDIDLLFVDGSEDTVQIGKLNINGAFTFPTADGSANQILKTDGNGAVSWAADGGGGGGGGSMTTVKANGTQVGGADIVTLDFASDFTVAETPDTEVNVSIADGAISSAKMTTSTLVLNEAGASVDFRVEGDTNENLLVVDGSADKVGIGVAAPDHTLQVVGNAKVDDIVIKEWATSAAYSSITHKDYPDSTYMMISNGQHTFVSSKANGITYVRGPGNTAISEIQVQSAAVVINEGGSNSDFRVEGDTDTHLLFSDASLDKIGIGLSTPTEKLDVNGNIKGGIVHATSGLNVGVSGLIHQSGTLVHSTHAAWGEFPGNAQNSINLLTGETTNATFTSLQMNNGMYSGVKLPSNKTFFADVNIVGRRTNPNNTTSQHAAYQLKACINNDGFGRSIIGSVGKTVVAETNSAWDVQLAFAGAGSGQTDYLLVQCKGAASTNVHWVAKVDLLEVGGLNEKTNYREANIYSNMSPEIIP